MFKQYFKQAIHALRENRLTSVVSILGTMLSVAMILVVVLQFQIKLVGYSPVSKRDRMLYIYSVNTKSKDGSENNNTGLSAETIRECLYTLKKPEAVTVTAQNSHVISIPGKRLFEEYIIPIPPFGKYLTSSSFPASLLRRLILIPVCLMWLFPISWRVSCSVPKTWSVVISW